jgi:hypothetical protein
MIQDKKFIVKILGTIFFLFGAFKLITGLKGSWWALQYLFNFQDTKTFSEFLYYGALTLLVTLIRSISAIIGGVGLLMYKKWGWIFSVIASLIIFVISSIGTINFIVASYRFRNTPMPPIPEDAVVNYYSMIPTYIQFAISPIVLLLLFRKLTKNSFS